MRVLDEDDYELNLKMILMKVKTAVSCVDDLEKHVFYTSRRAAELEEEGKEHPNSGIRINRNFREGSSSLLSGLIKVGMKHCINRTKKGNIWLT